jgi:hypothetical protein
LDAEIWGRCPVCARWFFCGGWFDPEVPEPSCPVCRAEPVAIENRAVRTVGTGELGSRQR